MLKAEDIKAYDLIEIHPLEDIDSEGYILKHKKSGARITLVSNKDENKVFYVGFRTPPTDSTGVAHIIEHSVLCGSEKFPCKDPFVELVKGSLNTFLNAMTYPDKTVYPVASCNDKDFANLMDVYLNAVFYPNIYKKSEIFKQEGWHYELESLTDPITINGVVYNEMKGAFSSPEGVVAREISNSLFPDTTYGNESGGNPENIPELTYQDFIDFHQKYYHPSNSYFYIYGNMDMAERLDWLDQEYLSKFDRIPVISEIELQKPFQEIRDVYKTYPVSDDDPVEHSTYLSYNMAISTALDKELYLAFEVLDYALLSAPGAPLKQALIDRGIGNDILGSYDNGTLQPVFSIVSKNADSSQKDEFKSVILEILKQQSEGALNKKSLYAGLNSMEFKFRESDFGNYPKGLIYGLQLLDSWLYDESRPFLHLEAIATFAFLRSKIEGTYFEDLIQTYMLDNTHVSMVTVEPIQGQNAIVEKELSDKLEAYKQGLTQDELLQLIEDTKALKRYQEEPSPLEELEKIPMLSREDLKTEAMDLNLKISESDGVKILHTDMFTSGIQYVNLFFDITDVAVSDIPYIGLLRSMLGYLDTKSYTYQDLANEINLETGGISFSTTIYNSIKTTGTFQVKFVVHLKTLYAKLTKSMELVKEIIAGTSFEDEKRLKEMLSEIKSRLQMALSSSGHSFSAIRAMSYFSESALYTESVQGIEFYRVVCDLEENFEDRKEELKEKFKHLMQRIFRQKTFILSITADEEGFLPIKNEVKGLREVLPVVDFKESIEPLLCSKKNEGFMDSSKVQYVSRAGNFLDQGHAYSGALRILKVILSYDYLWNQVRVQGGAYGCGIAFHRSGNAYFYSYRDPNIKRTNDVYNKVPNYLQEFSADEREMTKYIIGALSELDTPLNPSATGSRSVSAYFSEITLADLQRERDEILNAKQEQIQEMSNLVESVLAQEYLCVIGNEDKIKEDKELFMEIKKL